MDVLFLAGQVAALCALAYGCYLCIANWRLSDHAGIQREFHEAPGLAPSTPRYEAMSDPRAASEIGFLT